MQQNNKSLFQRLRPILMFLCFVFVLGFLLYSYLGAGDNKAAQLPIIYADESDYKIKPDNPGGFEIQHEDSTVFDALRGNPEWEQLSDDAEKQDEYEEIQFEDVRRHLSQRETDVLDEPSVENLFDVASEKPELPLTEEETTPIEILDPQPVVEDEERAENKEDIFKDIIEDTLEKETVSEKPKEAPKPTVKQPENAGDYYIQLGSFGNQEAANQGYERLLKKHNSEISKLGKRFVDIDIEGKGTFVRVQVGPKDKQTAQDVCSRLKEQGGSCLVVKK